MAPWNVFNRFVLTFSLEGAFFCGQSSRIWLNQISGKNGLINHHVSWSYWIDMLHTNPFWYCLLCQQNSLNQSSHCFISQTVIPILGLLAFPFVFLCLYMTHSVIVPAIQTFSVNFSSVFGDNWFLALCVREVFPLGSSLFDLVECWQRYACNGRADTVGQLRWSFPNNAKIAVPHSELYLSPKLSTNIVTSIFWSRRKLQSILFVGSPIPTLQRNCVLPVQSIAFGPKQNVLLPSKELSLQCIVGADTPKV